MAGGGAYHGSHARQAEVAHLVEHNLAKVGVAGSSPVFRSKSRPSTAGRDFFSLLPWWWNW